MKIEMIEKEREKVLRRKVTFIVTLAICACLFFLLYNALDAWQLIAKMRIKRLVGLVVVSISLSVATVIFQAVTRNRLLSPTVMGFDSMFSLIVTGSVFFLTSSVVNQIPRSIMFIVQAILMTIVSVTLFSSFVGKHRNNLYLMILVGMVLGSFLRSITHMMISIMDPNEYLNVQDAKTASFAVIDQDSLGITIIISIIAIGFIFRKRHIWDVLNLGEDLATNLGLNYAYEVKYALALSSILVACSTALVGPLMFFGLLIANIASFYLESSRMTYFLPTAAAMGVLVLIGGQAILEHVLKQGTVLPVVIEFVGGSLLLIMIIKEAKK